MPKGYIYAEFEVADAKAWAEYLPLAQASLAGLNARNIVGKNGPQVLEGDLGGRQISILEFESLEEAKAWYESPRYQRAIAVRANAAQLTALLFSGPEL